MNKEIYQKNMCALQKKYPAWANILQKKQKKRNFDVIVKKKSFRRSYFNSKKI